MRKNMMIATAGIAAVMMMASGCSSKTPAETTPVQTESTVQETTAQESEETVEEVVETGAAPGAEENLDIPLKIFGEITEVGEDQITVDNQSGNSSDGEIILMIDPENTYVLDGKDGLPVNLTDVQLGSFEAYLGPAMTMSLPPQATPYVVIVNIPEDMAAPQYAVAAGEVEEKDGKTILTANDGNEYEIAEDVQVLPYLTKNIVKLDDITEGSKCLVWQNEDGAVEKLVLFQD